MGLFSKLIPNRLRRKLLSLQIGFYDWNRTSRYITRSATNDQQKRLALITCHYHVLEKGLSMNDVRRFFGKETVLRLIKLLEEFCRDGGDEQSATYQTARQVIRAYVGFHEPLTGLDPTAEPYCSAKAYLERRETLNVEVAGQGGGRKALIRQEVQAAAKGSFPELMQSRCSVRHFGSGEVSDQDIEQAVRWAQKSPSVCNRQEIRVIRIGDKQAIQSILELQGGARGFLEQVDKLLIVGGDLRAFHSAAERNQVYCDSGIFAMSLLLSLHYLGYGTCPLHWCVDPEKDRRLRSLAGIPDPWSVAVLIAIGTLPDQFNVAFSQRVPLQDVLQWR